MRDAELEEHPWKFAIQRASLAANDEEPEFGRDNAFTLPSDFIRLLNPYPEDDVNTRDWIIEGREVLTDDEAPLEIRYVARVTDTSLYSPLFVMAVAHKLAWYLCEKLTQSNTKKADLTTAYEEVIRRAKRANAFQTVPARSVTSSWITVRA